MPLVHVKTVLKTPLKLVTIAAPEVVWLLTLTPLKNTVDETDPEESARIGAAREDAGAVAPSAKSNRTAKAAMRTHPDARFSAATGTEVANGG